MRCDKAEGGYSALITTVNQSINHSVSLGKMMHSMDADDLLHCPWGSLGSSAW